MADEANASDPAHIRGVFERYGTLMAAGDVAGIVALYAPDACIEDPIGSGEKCGHEAIAAFYQAGFDAMQGGIEMRLEGNPRIAGRHAAAAFIAWPRHYPDSFEVETLDVMEFDESGLIRSMRAYWGPGNRRAVDPA